MLEKGTRVLLTHPKIQEFIGSTIVTYELALYLKELGVDITIFTYCFMEPASKLFVDKNIKVIYEPEEDVTISDYDVIWVQGQIVPIGVISELNDCCKKPIFIFHHMSAMEDCSDEFPYIPDFEDDLSSLSLFVSEECKNAVNKFLKREIPHVMYRNPVPEIFCEDHESVLRKNIIKKVLIVSNHIPCELLNLKDKMKDFQVIVDYYGMSQSKYELISKDILLSYDLVITIGKTVQYCLVLGVPVYIYDHFGGYGYLNSDNLKKYEQLNYSGRGGFRKSSDEIVSDIFNNFSKAKDFYYSNLVYFKNRYNIKNTIDEINNKNLSTPVFNKVSEQKILAYIVAQKFSRRFFNIWGIGHSNIILQKKMFSHFQISTQELVNFGNLKIFRAFIKGIVFIFRCLRSLKRFLK